MGLESFQSETFQFPSALAEKQDRVSALQRLRMQRELKSSSPAPAARAPDDGEPREMYAFPMSFAPFSLFSFAYRILPVFGQELSSSPSFDEQRILDVDYSDPPTVARPRFALARSRSSAIVPESPRSETHQFPTEYEARSAVSEAQEQFRRARNQLAPSEYVLLNLLVAFLTVSSSQLFIAEPNATAVGVDDDISFAPAKPRRPSGPVTMRIPIAPPPDQPWTSDATNSIRLRVEVEDVITLLITCDPSLEVWILISLIETRYLEAMEAPVIIESLWNADVALDPGEVVGAVLPDHGILVARPHIVGSGMDSLLSALADCENGGVELSRAGQSVSWLPGARAIPVLAFSSQKVNLTQVNLSRSYVDPVLFSLLCHLFVETAPNVQTLDLSWNRLTSQSVVELVSALNGHGSLSALVLSGNLLGDAAADCLCELGESHDLKSLSLASCGLSAHCMHVWLSRRPSNQFRCAALDLSRNRLGNEGANDLFAFLTKGSGCLDLCLAGCGVSSVLEARVKDFLLQGVLHLGLGSSSVIPSMLQTLGDARSPSLTSLNLASCRLDGHCLRVLCEAASRDSFPSLSRLVLRGNSFPESEEVVVSLIASVRPFPFRLPLSLFGLLSH